MKNERIGNDLNVVWSLMSGGQPFNIQGREVTIYLKSQFGKTEIKDFKLSGNMVLWTFYGKDQKYTGIYSLELVINEGEKGMITTDKCKFVNLVACSCKVGGESEPNVEIETIELTSVVEFNYDDTEIRQELAKKVNKEDVPEWINDAVIISPLSDSSAIIKAFNEHKLAEKKGVTLLTFVKRERFYEDYELAALVVEDYNTQGAGWRLTFTLLGVGANAKADDMEAIFSNNVFGSTKVLSFLYDERSGYVIPLGEGEVKIKEPDNKVDKVNGKQLSTNDYTDAEREKLKKLTQYDDAEIRSAISQLDDNKANKIDVNKNLANKVDKIAGKGLSTEDFTSVLKAKLETLSDYDDTAITNAIRRIESSLNTLVNGDATEAIESFNEIVSFLDGVKDTQDLAGIIASIEQQIAGKQDTITDLQEIRNAVELVDQFGEELANKASKTTVEQMAATILLMQEQIVDLYKRIEEISKPSDTSNVLGVAKVGYAVLS